MNKILLGLFLLMTTLIFGQNSGLDKAYASVERKVIDWRRDFHQNPELSNREFKTAEKITKHLRSLGIEVQTGVGKTGVVGILKGSTFNTYFVQKLFKNTILYGIWGNIV